MPAAASIFDDSDDNNPEMEEETHEPEASDPEPPPDRNDNEVPANVKKAVSLDEKIASLTDKRNELLKKVYEKQGVGPWSLDGESVYIRKRKDAFTLHQRRQLEAVSVFDED